jgi:hypothetical protein
MGQKGVVFTTALTTKQCADVFRSAGDSARGGWKKMLEASATVIGNGDRTGYYTPRFSSPFASVDGTPDFAVGVNILKFSAGAQGNGTHVHMYVDDEGDNRAVQLVSSHGLMDGSRSAKLVRKFLDQFKAADRKLRVTDGNI